MTLPTTEQLTLIAATLSKPGNGNAATLTDAALKLWQAAERKLDSERQIEARSDKWNAEFDALPKPKSFPVDRDQFARLMLPSLVGRTADLAKAIKDYIGATTSGSGHEGKPTDAEIAERFSQWKPIINEHNFQLAARKFSLWWQDHHKAKISEMRRDLRNAAIKEAAEKLPPKKGLKKKL